MRTFKRSIRLLPGRWGKCHLRNEERVLRLSRISSLAPALPKRKPPHFRVPRRFRIARYVKREAWQLSKDKSEEVTIRFSPDIAWYARNNWGHVGSWKKDKRGAAVLKTVSNDPGAMIRWLLRFREGAEIIEPASYRELMGETLRGIVNKYKLG